MMHRELELKLEIAAEDVERLRHVPPLAFAPVSRQRQESIYFDTPSQTLRRAGFTLRVRRSGGMVVQTIKEQNRGAGLFDRAEWEAPIRGMRPDLQATQTSPVAELLRKDEDAKLEPLARMTIDRTRWELAGPDHVVEVTLDEGTVRSGDDYQRVNELELELKQGSEATLFGLCEQLGKQVPLRLGVLSKADRALAVASGKIGKPVKAPRVELRPDMTVAEGFTTIALSCLQHFRLNEGLLVEQRLTEALHQVRVAMRRLRSAFRLFRPVLRQSREYRRLLEELAGFSRTLGRARNLDIFIALLGEHDVELRQLRNAREAAYGRILETLNSRRLLNLMLAMLRWLFVGKWRQRSDSRAPLASFINWRIDKAWTQLKDQRHRILDMTDKQRHRLRIRVKQLRYALEFTRAYHRDAKDERKRFRRALESLQEQLGLLNDQTVARRLARHNGWSATNIDDTQLRSAALDRAERDYAELMEAEPYWRERTLGRGQKPALAGQA